MKLLQTLSLVLPLTAAASSSTVDTVDEFVLMEMQRQKIPGLSLVIVQNGSISKIEGYGLANVEHGVSASPDTIFQSGSVGKQFTAAGVLALVDDGKLRLDDPLARHFQGSPSAWHRITVRQLLSHTSGLKDYGDDEVDLRRDYTEDELLQIAMKLPVEFEPGSQWSYSNSGYMVLGILTSRLTGEHWSDFVRKRIFEPAGMTTAQVITETGIVANRAAGYERGEDGGLQNQEWVSPALNRLGDGALYFTVRDLAAWDATLRESRLLSPASYEAWWTPVNLGDGVTYPYGFGWDIGEQRGRRVIQHGGSWQGFRAAISRYVDDDITIAVLANVDDARPEDLVHEIAGLVEPGLRLPSIDQPGDDPDQQRAERLRGVLEAWAAWHKSDDMGRGLAATASGSAREAYGRTTTGRRLAAAKSFVWLADDDVSRRRMERRGEKIARIAYYALETADARFRYRFYLTTDDRVADFAVDRIT